MSACRSNSWLFAAILVRSMAGGGAPAARWCLCVRRLRMRALRQQLVEHRVPAQVDRALIAHDRVEGAVGEEEHLAAAAHVETGGRLGAEVGVIDDVADDRRRAGDPAA